MMCDVRRLAASVVLVVALGVNPISWAGICPSAASAHVCCCAPQECACPEQSPAGLAGQLCGCGPSAPVPLAPQPASAAPSGPGSELAAMAARATECVGAPAPHRATRTVCSLPAAAGISLFLLDCALLI